MILLFSGGALVIKQFLDKKGSITIFLSLLIVPMFLLAGVIIDVARVVSAKSMISGAGDLTMNAALSNYNSELKDVYGIFAVTEIPTAKLENHFQNSISGDDIVATSENSHFIDLTVNSFEIVGVPGSELTNPDVLERQIIEYMKYRVPSSAIKFFEVSKSEAVKQKMQVLDSNVQRLNQYVIDTKLGESLMFYEKSDSSQNLNGAEVPTGRVSAMLPSGFKESSSSTANSQTRTLATINSFTQQLGNLEIANFYLMSYLTEMFSCWTTPSRNLGSGFDNQMFSSYGLSMEDNYFYRGEIEYIIWGADEVGQNLKYAEAAIYTTRLIANSSALLTNLDPRQLNELTRTDQSEQLAMLSTEIITETEHDVEALLNGEAIPFSKPLSDWFSKQVNQFSSQQNDNPLTQVTEPISLDYQQYLKLFTLISTLSEDRKSDMLIRTSQLIQINLATSVPLMENSAASFDLSQAYTFVKLNADVSIRTTFLSRTGSSIAGSGNGGVTNQYHGVSGY